MERHRRRRRSLDLHGNLQHVLIRRSDARASDRIKSVFGAGAGEAAARGARAWLLESRRACARKSSRSSRESARQDQVKVTVLYVGSSLLAPLRNAEREINREHAID